MKLTSEYLRTVRFTVRRGNTYDAAEVDAFMDELLAAVRTQEEERPEYPDRTSRLEAVCEIRAEMTERIMREILSAEKRLEPLISDEQ